MTWKLVAVEGPIEASEYLLDAFPVTIGRKRDNRIPISHPSVSRYHCHIVDTDAGPRLVDLGSQNGVFVNGDATAAKVLSSGDEIRVGPARFRLEQSSEPSAATNGQASESPAKPDFAETVRAPAAEVVVPETVELDAEETAYLRRKVGSGSSTDTGERAARDLRALLALCRQIQQSESPELVQRRLLEALFGAIPAERGAVVLAAPGAVRLGEALCLDRLRGPVQLDLSRSTLASVIDNGRVFLRNRIQGDPSGLPESLISGEIQAALAAPLTFNGRTIGAIYLDTTREDRPFDRQDLNLATAAAAAAAGVLESAFREQVLRRGIAAAWSESGLDERPLDFLPEMREAVETAAQAAKGAAPVVIVGEVGSGRRALAESIHVASASPNAPFVSIHCAGREPEAVETELWGSEDSPGKLELASGGTLYMVEIGALPKTSQGRLVSLLEDEALGARLVASTSRDLRGIAAAGNFREDLLYRLGGIAIETVPLRACRKGIVDLAEYLARRSARAEGRPFEGFSPGARKALESYAWPGNIAELANAVDGAVRIRAEHVVELEDLPDAVADAAYAPGYHERVREAKRRILSETLERAGGSVPAAAAELGINRTYLHRLIRNLKLRDDDPESDE